MGLYEAKREAALKFAEASRRVTTGDSLRDGDAEFVQHVVYYMCSGARYASIRGVQPELYNEDGVQIKDEEEFVNTINSVAESDIDEDSFVVPIGG